MSEEVYGSEMGLCRVHEEPYTGTARHSAKSKRIKMTGLSFAGLKENIRKKKIEKKIEKYNMEYKALFDLALDVDSAREEMSAGKSDYSVVKESVELYNRQARRLAEIGVQVLMLNEDIQKISFGNEASAKALKVPGFLIGPLKFLNKAGREQARIEKEARLEKERAIADTIVATAEEAVGQIKNAEVDEEKLISLEGGNLAKTVISELTEPTVDEEAAKKAAEEEAKAKAEAEAAEKERKEKEEAEAKEKLEKLRSAGAAALAKNYGKAKSGSHTDAAKVEEAIENENAFDVLRNLNDVFRVGKVNVKNRVGLGLTHKRDGKFKIIMKSEFGDKFCTRTDGDTVVRASDEEVAVVYKNTLNMAKLGVVWNKVATREVQDENGTKIVSGLDEENRGVFNFVYDAVNEGLTAEEIKEKASQELSEEEVKVVVAAMDKYDVIANGMQSLKLNLTEPAKKEVVESEDEKEETPVDENKDEIYAAGVEKIREIGLSLYSKKKSDEAVVESEDEKAEEVVTPVVEEDKKEEVVEDKKEEPVVGQQKVSLGFVDQIGILVAEIEALTANRDKLKQLLGDEANESLEKINKSINERLARINALASGSVVSLGKDGEKKEETPVVVEQEEKAEEVVTPVVEEDKKEEVVEDKKEEPVVEDKTKVISQKDEMKVEEKAEIDARVITGQHVHVDAKPENFTQDSGVKYAVAESDPYTKLLSGGTDLEEAEKLANRGILTDAERENALDWWSRFAPILDNPSDARKALTEIRLEEARKERERRALEKAVEDEEFEVKRQMRIEEEHRRVREQKARSQLKYCSALADFDIDKFIEENGQNVAEEDRFDSPYGLVCFMEKRAPKMYEDMMTSYNDAMAAKKEEMINNGYNFSDPSTGGLKK